jgi:hypothetical protein
MVSNPGLGQDIAVWWQCLAGGARHQGRASCSHDHRGHSFLWTCQELPDGTRVRERDLPPPCPEYGEVLEEIVEIVEVVVETPRRSGTSQSPRCR